MPVYSEPLRQVPHKSAKTIFQQNMQIISSNKNPRKRNISILKGFTDKNTDIIPPITGFNKYKEYKVKYYYR